MVYISNRLAAHLTVLLLSFAVFSVNAETVTPLKNSSVSEASMAELLAGAGVTVSNPSYSAVKTGYWYNQVMNREQAGQFSGFSFLLGSGFDRGVVLSTGRVTDVLGPNNAANRTTAFSDYSVNDPDLGSKVFDPVKFSFTVIPDNEILIIDFVFGSEEYSEYVGASYNDLARIFVDGQNCALTPAGNEVRVNNIHSDSLPPHGHHSSYPNNDDGISNSGMYLDNSSSAPVFNTEMDGYTRRMSCRVAVVPGQPVDVVTGIADIADAKYDSWIFFRAESIRSEPARDYGDAPDSYGTLSNSTGSTSSGAAHTVVDGVYLGAVGVNGVTGDANGFGDGIDDSAGQATDDSDNALTSVPTILSSANSYSVTLNATSTNGKSAQVIGWIDFDLDGQFQQDEASSIVTVGKGEYEKSVTLTWNNIGVTGTNSGTNTGANIVVSGVSYLRLRIANDGINANAPTGLLSSGEVEDYLVIISDGLAPSVVSVERFSPQQELTNADSLIFRVVFSELVSNLDAADFMLTAGVVSNVAFVSGQDNTKTIVDVTVADIANYNGVISLSLANNNDITDSDGNSISAINIPGAQNYILDNSAPAAPILLGISQDSGVAGDFITADTRLVFSGSGEINTEISVFIDGNLAGVVNANEQNAWTFDYTNTEFANGSYILTTRATDAAGNVSPMSAPVVVVVDNIPPLAPVVSSITDDSGVSSTDGITNDATLVFAGTAEAGQYITVMLNGAVIGSVNSSGNGAEGGSWSLDYSGTTLPDASYEVTVVSTDLAGNISASSAPFSLTVDTSAVATLTFTEDGQTLADNQPKLSGTTDPGAYITVTLDDAKYTALADDSGKWVIQVSSDLNNGPHQVDIAALDDAGNEKTQTGTFTVGVSVSTANSTVGAAPLIIPANGVTAAVISIEIRDSANNVVTGLMPSVETDLGMISNIQELGNGLYSAELTSQDATGTATVEVYAAGTLLGQIGIVVVVADEDGDGVSDGAEDSNGDGDPTNDDLDGDGVSNHQDPDDDGDGRDTTAEDTNGDGDPSNDDDDGDGIPNYLDADDDSSDGQNDSDRDGVADTIECEGGIPCIDTDGDGLPDYMDNDDDADGIPTAIEGSERDTDNDGIPDFRDNDDDGDGIDTINEDHNIDGDGDASTNAGPDDDGDRIPAYLDPNDSETGTPGDSDSDGLTDAQECQAGSPCEDSDGDGQPDYFDSDDDNDGRPTVSEDPNGDGDPTNDDTDGDGIPNYLDPDDDGDGIMTSEEGDGDPDGDSIPDYLDGDGPVVLGDGTGDTDGDGLSDLTECPLFTGICRDSDNDGTPDYGDADDDNDGRPTATEDPDGNGDQTNDDTDGDGIPNYRDPDDDGDGFDTIDEGTGDSDGDGIPDYLDPSAGDSDNDGIPDGAECPDGVPCRDTDSDGIPDYVDEDDDNDGIPTINEDINNNDDPSDDDTDGDGIADYLDPDDDGDGVDTRFEDPNADKDPTNDDRDGDGIPDYRDPDSSNNAGTSDGTGDSDEDGVSDGRECPALPCRDTDGNGTPDYLSPDDDGDGVNTVDEDINNDGDPTNDDTDADGRPNFLDPDDDGDGFDTRAEGDGDRDNDGIPDYLDPTGGDLDGDGLSDASECPLVNACWDSDDDGDPNYLDPDDDGDGIPTILEDPNGNGDPRDDDTDNDGIPDYLDKDDDGDGIPSSNESGTGDADKDGIPDYLDRDTSNQAGMPDGSGDSDGDGLSDAEECGTGPVCEDIDGNGTPDYMEAPGVNASVANELLPGGKVAASLPVLGSLSTLWLALLALPLIRVRRRTLMAVLSLFSLLGISANSAAFEPKLDDFYAGGGLGLSRLTPETSGSSFENDDESGLDINLIAGYRLVDDFSLELQYHRLGSASLRDTNTDVTSEFSFSALGAYVNWYPWQVSWDGKGHVRGFVAAGLNNISNSADIDYEQEAAMSLALAAGVEYEFKDTWQARIAGNMFTRDVQVIQISLLKRFGSQNTAPVVKPPVLQPIEEIAEPVPTPPPLEPVEQDSDHDGVIDAADNCPGTPLDMTVNAQGCSVLDARLDGVYFDSGSATLTYGSLTVLKQVVTTLKSYPNARMEIGAHTDSVGSASGNQQLSERRAISVMQYLIDMGIDAGRLEARGYGEENPIADNATSAGRAENRRVEIKLID